MENQESVVCGIIVENGEYAPIFCNVNTGECYFNDELMGDGRLITELSVSEPVEMDFEDMVQSHQEGAYGKCIGVIYDGECVIKLLTDTTAASFDIDDLSTPISQVYQINIYGDYETEEIL